ncbi:MAG: multidrug transporter, partial [Candidatus Poribacteria bacterium]|nr:multidrug transporter [Candidatus Poribacteria bacterium]
SYTLILYLLMTEKVSYIVALRQCSVILAVLFGGYKLNESGLKLRLAGAVLMVLGMFIITTAG